MDSAQVDLITKLADAFKASGPFLFSILLAAGWLWTITKAIAIYKDRSGGPGLRRTLLAFAGAFLVGSVVIGWRAIDWWLEAQDTPFGRYATILRVPNDISVWADAAQLYQQKLEAQHSPTHSLRIAFLFKSQCPDDDVLIVQMNREGMQKPDTFRLNCSALDNRWQTTRTFDLDVDEKGTLVLKHLNPRAGSSTKAGMESPRFALVGDAQAGEPPVYRSLTQRTYEPIKGTADLNDAAAVLQSPRVPPGAKVEALGQLEASMATIKPLIGTEAFNRSLGEPLYATLLDLQRHSDRQLARRAQIVLGALPLLDDLERMSRSPGGRKQVEAILASMSERDVERLQRGADPAGYQALVSAVTRNSSQPIPTYTRDGDRFFVKASWDNRDEKTVQCIGKAYYEHWGGTSLEQQTDLVRSKTTRTVYYTKPWAQEMLRMLQACGATAAYTPAASDAPEAPVKALK